MSNKLIGKGSFTKVFHDGKSPTVVMSSFDKVKQCLAAGWMPESALLPTVNFLEHIEGASNLQQLYKMPFYPSMKQRAVKPHLDAENWALYQQLRVVSTAMKNHFVSHYGKVWRDYEIYDGSLKIIGDSALSDSMKLFMEECYESLSNYGQRIRFEISPRNVATENGKLILVDCFLFSDDLDSTRTVHNHLAHDRKDIQVIKDLDLGSVEAVEAV